MLISSQWLKIYNNPLITITGHICQNQVGWLQAYSALCSPKAHSQVTTRDAMEQQLQHLLSPDHVHVTPTDHPSLLSPTLFIAVFLLLLIHRPHLPKDLLACLHTSSIFSVHKPTFRTSPRAATGHLTIVSHYPSLQHQVFPINIPTNKVIKWATQREHIVWKSREVTENKKQNSDSTNTNWEISTKTCSHPKLIH